MSVLKGGCLCGAIRYEVNSEPLFSGFCHCRDCQRTTGTGHCCYMIFDRADVTMSGAGRGYETRAENGNPSVRYFCETCGSQVYGSGPPDDPRVSIYAGTLDDPSVFQPTDAIFTRSRHEWDRSALVLGECEALPG